MNSPAKEKMLSLLKIPEVQSWRSLLRSFRYVVGEINHKMLKMGCSLPRFQILFHLYFKGPLPAVRIAEIMVVTRGNISTFLKRMQADGLIRPASEVGTKSRPYFELSPEGEKTFEEIFPAHVEMILELVRPFSEITRKEIREMVPRDLWDEHIDGPLDQV